MWSPRQDRGHTQPSDRDQVIDFISTAAYFIPLKNFSSAIRHLSMAI